MTTDIVTISKDAPVSDAVLQMTKNDIGSIIVIENERVIGILTERDIVKRIASKNKDCCTLNVSEIMTSPVVTSPADVPILKECFDERGFRRLPIIEGGKPIGIVTEHDVTKAMKELALELLANEVKRQTEK